MCALFQKVALDVGIPHIFKILRSSLGSLLSQILENGLQISQLNPQLVGSIPHVASPISIWFQRSPEESGSFAALLLEMDGSDPGHSSSEPGSGDICG